MALLWAQWVLFTAAGWIAGSAIAWTLTEYVHVLRESALGLAAAGGAVGVSVGVAQWLVLRPPLRRGTSWILCTALAWGAGAFVAGWVNDSLFDDYWLLALLPSAVLFATAIGLGQWLVLRRLSRGAGWWVPVSALAWTVIGCISLFSGPGAGVALPAGLFSVLGSGGWLAAGIVAVIPGTLTGVALVRLLGRSAFGHHAAMWTGRHSQRNCHENATL